jgi:hypothetical protein
VTELLPVRLLEQCERRRRILPAPWSQFVTSRSISANVLALAPRVLVAVRGTKSWRRSEAPVVASRVRGAKLCVTAERTDVSRDRSRAPVMAGDRLAKAASSSNHSNSAMNGWRPAPFRHRLHAGRVTGPPNRTLRRVSWLDARGMV